MARANRKFADRVVDAMQWPKELAAHVKRRFVLVLMLYTAGVIRRLAAPGVASVTV